MSRAQEALPEGKLALPEEVVDGGQAPVPDVRVGISVHNTHHLETADTPNVITSCLCVLQLQCPV